MKTVLLVEDNSDDVLLMKKALEVAAIPQFLSVVNDGQAAIDYLSGAEGYSDRVRHPLPDLVFLDVKLPRRTGHEVLDWIRAQAQFKDLPVVMLTISSVPADIERAHRLGVSSYMLKSADPREFNHAIRVVLKYWLK